VAGEISVVKSMGKSFTLIEIVVVMVIIGIIAAVSVNRFFAYQEMKVNLAARKLVSDIRFAQNLAASYHADVGIEFSVSNNWYRVYNVSSGTNYTDPSTHQEFVINYTSDPQFGGVNIASANFDGNATLIFNSLGKPENVGGADLVANGSIGLSYGGFNETVQVYAGTGFCKQN